MKNLIFIMVAIIAFGCEKQEKQQPLDRHYDGGVLIGDIVWATRNIDGYYKGYIAFTPTIGDEGDMHSADACPNGWRLPTIDEVSDLDNYSKIETKMKNKDGDLAGGILFDGKLFIPYTHKIYSPGGTELLGAQSKLLSKEGNGYSCISISIGKITKLNENYGSMRCVKI